MALKSGKSQSPVNYLLAANAVDWPAIHEVSKRGVRVIACHRRPSVGDHPCTLDDFENVWPNLLEAFKQRGVVRVCVIARKEGDATYEPVLQEFLRAAQAHDMEAPLLIREDQLPSSPPAELQSRSALLCFTPNVFQEIKSMWPELWHSSKPPLRGCFSIFSLPIDHSDFDFMLESQLDLHAKIAIAMMLDWERSQERPASKKIEMKLVWNDT